MSYQSIVDKARSIAKNLIKIRDIQNYQTNLKYRAFEIVVSDDKEEIFNDLVCNQISNFGTIPKELCGNESYYIKVENRFSELENIYKDKLSYMTEFEKLLDEYLEEIGENVSDKVKKNYLCFILNRASHYLSNNEQIIENYDLELLKKIDKLRRKINILLLINRYKYEQNKRPILDIEIERYKILIDTLEKTGIFLEKTYVQKFIEALGNAFESKANNLKEEKDFDALSLREIQDIAKVRNKSIIANENIIDAMKNKIEDLNENLEKNNNEIKLLGAKFGLEFIIEQGKAISGIAPTKNNVPQEKDVMDKISNLMAENKKIFKSLKNYEYKLSKMNLNQNYDITFINILKLYFQLVRRGYQSRNDYFGLIILEVRKYVNRTLNNVNTKEEQVNLREYEIKEISHDNNYN